MEDNKRHIYVNYDTIEYANSSKELVESVALAIAVKSAFVSSHIHGVNQKDIASLLKCDVRKVDRIVANAIKHGYVRSFGDGIIANPLKVYKEDCVQFVNASMIQRQGKDNIKSCLSGNVVFTAEECKSLKDIVKAIKKKILVKHIHSCNKVRYKTLREKHSNKDGTYDRSNTSCNDYGISYKRLMEIANIGNRNKLLSLIRELVKEGYIIKANQNVELFSSKESVYMALEHVSPIVNNRAGKAHVVARKSKESGEFCVLAIFANKFFLGNNFSDSRGMKTMRYLLFLKKNKFFIQKMNQKNKKQTININDLISNDIPF